VVTALALRGLHIDLDAEIEIEELLRSRPIGDQVIEPREQDGPPAPPHSFTVGVVSVDVEAAPDGHGRECGFAAIHHMTP
jgi:hypothetical protein